MDDLKVIGFIPDCHIPHEDQDAYNLMLNVLTHLDAQLGIDMICLLGDYVDVYGLSFHEKDPTKGLLHELYDEEILATNARLSELDNLFPNALKIYIEGNHEVRLTRFIKRFAPALVNRIALKTELQLDKRKNWRWIPYDSRQSVQIYDSPLYARHAPVAGGGITNNARKGGESFIHGHIHHLAFDYVVNKLSGVKNYAIAGGFLGDLDSDVFDYVKDRPDWDLGFVIGYVKKDWFDFQTVRIDEKEKTCIFDGRRFS